MFAKHAHAGQKRRYTGEDYIVHPIAVAGLVNRVRHSSEMLAAALLHDTVEDTPVTAAAIRSEFGAEVAELVGWVTDVSTLADGDRAERKRLDREHVARAPASAKTIKLADLIDNSSTIVAQDPMYARMYLAEKALLLDVLREGDAVLWAQAHQLLQAGASATGLVVEWGRMS
ncbi:(p)ppGpp synthase/HD superfamily hydrolase [Xanthomonas sacchari]|uniref:HD domain-containing protein n=1 Tax=Xanthomonas sacchari TaxID=56458 RepID=UPI0027885DC9|nr:HD domain-containing protein [Xanthomonas sacchari]MDQ1090680.1 (p)ppGpp synthase/HD superfamily hydrolase [Xanthomonas sacchari]